MSQALYRKWRPARFDDVVGQEHVTRTLRNAVAAGRVGHAYLFCGPRGTGKTTTARLLAKAVNCLHEDESERPCNSCANCRAIREGRFLDLIEIDAASNTGVDDIRDLRDKINFSPSEGRFKVYIIDEVHMLSTAAFNALLKTLEEPPAHAKFVLATTEEHKVPMTIKSRCQQFNFRLLSLQEIAGRLQWMAGQESLELEPDALNLIARQGAGSIRDAESLLDQLVTAPGDQITLARAQMVLGTASSEAVAALTDALLSGDGPGGLAIIHEALTTGADARQFARQMVDHLRQVLLIQAAGDNVAVNATAEEQEVMQHQARRASREQLIEAVRAFNDAALSSSSSWQPQLPLELAFIEQLPEQPMPPTATAASEHGEPATQRQVKEAPEQTAPTPQTKTAAGAERPAETAKAAPPAAAPEETAAEPPAPEPKAPQEGPTASAAASARAEADTPQTTQSEDALSLQAIRDHWPAMVSQAGRQ
ncbi:MAG: DNA polymerase III subunit gamma/tau, partial [Candidatus Promineifilaceae bacterium]|nr:DNA polymerase III subunit gamma/tau [Candidatus Promineifilaceae bacterium]